MYIVEVKQSFLISTTLMTSDISQLTCAINSLCLKMCFWYSCTGIIFLITFHRSPAGLQMGEWSQAVTMNAIITFNPEPDLTPIVPSSLSSVLLFLTGSCMSLFCGADNNYQVTCDLTTDIFATLVRSLLPTYTGNHWNNFFFYNSILHSTTTP